MTRVIVDRNAGLCGGVRRAIRRTEKLLAEKQRAEGRKRIVSYGQLVHNREVTDALAAQGLDSAETPQEVAKGEAVVLRTHGVSPQERELLRSGGAELFDFTCPRVAGVQRQIAEKRREGRSIVIVGDGSHPEVQAHLGYSGAEGMVVSCVEEADRVPLGRAIAVFAQTTITTELFHQVVEALRSRDPALAVVDSLCPFVLKRQRWIDKQARLADASLILGGKNSSNTCKLHSIAASHGPAFHIGSAEELDVVKMMGYPRVALTAGASTSDLAIREVLARLEEAGARIKRL
jgi:(E)-4-hydroxy-3-methyl-but-2-enyl pyrophosphate reductase